MYMQVAKGYTTVLSKTRSGLRRPGVFTSLDRLYAYTRHASGRHPGFADPSAPLSKSSGVYAGPPLTRQGLAPPWRQSW